MKLVIVESPAKCKTIKKYLDNDFVVLASYGHVRDLPSKKGSIKPENDFEMTYEVNAESEKKIKDICKHAKKSDVIYLATDPDREGEAISWHLLEILKERKLIKKTTEIYRVAFNEITKKAVTNAIKNPRQIDMNLVNSQQARRALDYLVGYGVSPILWVKLPGSRSAGRVQSVALKAICEREKEISDFKVEEYWKINADFEAGSKKTLNSMLHLWQDEKVQKFTFTKQAQVDEIIAKIDQEKYFVKNVEKKELKRRPSAPFITSSLQQEASRKLGFGASKTMRVAQKLYEGMEIDGETVGLITYMRTDSIALSKDAIPQIRNVIESKYGKEFLPPSPRMFKSKAKNAQEAHEAIRPTDPSRFPENVRKFLSPDEQKLYDLIWKRTMACQMADAILNSVSVFVESENKLATFKATGSTIKFAGFYKIYREGVDDQEEESELLLPDFNVGQELKLQKIFGSQHFTEPPPRYNEATLVKKLEELGIGRPSTYASIISVIQDRNYAKLDNRRFIPEDRGLVVTAFLETSFHKYVEYSFTANLENELDSVAEGSEEWKNILQNFWGDFSHHIEKATKSEGNEMLEQMNEILSWHFFDATKEDDQICPKCKENLLVKLSRYGAFISCSAYPECDYRRNAGSDADGEMEFEPKMLGNCETTGLDVWLKKGPYGFYLELPIDKSEEVKKTSGKKTTKKPAPKRVSVPSIYDIQDIDLKKAQGLLSLPREIGTHPETGKVIKAGIGRYGPYLYYESKYTSIKDADILEIGINKAVDVLANAAKSGGASALRVIGNHPSSGDEIAVYNGRFGPYIKFEKLNVSVPKKFSVEDLTMEDAIELIEKKKAKKK